MTTNNYYELFNGILNPKQLEGLRLLLTPFAQQQFNLTADRRSERPSLEYRASIATKMAAPMRPRIRRATFVLRRCATGSTLQRFAESTFNGCSVRNGH